MILLFFLTIFQLRHSREGVFIFVFSSLFTYVAFVLGGFDSIRHAAFFPAGGVAAFLIAGRDLSTLTPYELVSPLLVCGAKGTEI